MDALKIAYGDTVADIGAGSGFFTVRLARRVDPRKPASSMPKTFSSRCWSPSNDASAVRD